MSEEQKKQVQVSSEIPQLEPDWKERKIAFMKEMNIIMIKYDVNVAVAIGLTPDGRVTGNIQNIDQRTINKFAKIQKDQVNQGIIEPKKEESESPLVLKNPDA